MRKQKRQKQKIVDAILQLITYFCSSLSAIILIALLMFMVSKGSGLISWDLLTNDYWSQNKNLEPYKTEQIQEFQEPSDLSKDAKFSKKWGIALVDYVNNSKQKLVLVEYVDPNSIFANMKDTSIKSKIKDAPLEKGMQIEKLQYTDKEGNIALTGSVMKHNATKVVEAIETAQQMDSIFVKTQGGGIKGSLIATLYLLAISLLLALPIGICSAIYLSEYAKQTKWNQLIRNGIEMLTGVPSIVFGLMGITVLFPITQLFHATTTSILLGSFTMAIILLPIIMRSCEEALLVVPKHLKDASLALGATQTQTLFKVILPCALPGILTGVLLSIGRVIGESAALIYTMGTFISDQPTITSQGTSLAVHIWSVMSGEQPNFELAAAISLIILMIVLVLNITVKCISKKFMKKWS